MNNKKGISAIVATVLIILITVAAVTIIWAAIIPMIQDQIGGSQECLAASSAVLVDPEYSCVNAESITENGACLDTDPFVENGACLDSEVSCAETDDTPACAETDDVEVKESVEVQVSRSTGDFELVAIDIVVGAGGNTDSERITIGEGVLGPNGAKVFKLTEGTDYDLDASVTEVGVVAVVEAGQTSKACSRSAMVQLSLCSP